ncbi:MAG TPA: cytochrome c biogenesis protein CcdC [Terriglobales bacterium]|nr:cytochrome c biogenesis protein CcdC [Terriglobales bacterium]
MHIPAYLSMIVSLAGLTAVLMWRVREARTAVSMKKIVMPPLGMATGFSMFLVPAFRIPWTWAALAFAIGSVALAYPLLRTSRLVRQGETVMMQRSSAFFVVILSLAAVRFFARAYLDSILSVQKTAALFFVLAFGMVLRWRAQMFVEYRRVMAADSLA